MRCPGLQQDRCRLHLPLPGGDVEGGVAVGRGSVGVGHVLQQKLHNFCFSQTGRNVKGRLVLLKIRVEEKWELKLKISELQEGKGQTAVVVVSPGPWHPQLLHSSADT